MVDKKVYHKNYGTGIITRINDEGSIATIDFDGKTYRFPYPDAFEESLTAVNSEDQQRMLEAIESKKNKAAKEREGKSEYQTTKRPPRSKTPAHKNIIFKFNYCDGGASDQSLGFNGVCSEKNIRYNIEKAKRRWCSYDDCPCARYFNGDYTYEDLVWEMDNFGSVCNESGLLRDWEAYMGWDLTTDDGKPRKLPDYVRTNSLCILTTREPEKSESERIVFAVFMVKEHIEGDESQAGGVKAHPDYRIELTPKQARKIFLWDYYSNRNNPLKPRWGTGLTRTMDDDNAVALLADIVKVKRGADDEAQALKLLEHFCELNGYDAENLPEKCGALNLK